MRIAKANFGVAATARRKRWFGLAAPSHTTGRLLISSAACTAIPPIGRIATLLTVVSMAALGLGVDVRVR